MIVQLRIPDEIHEKYKTIAPTGPEKAMTSHLERFSDVKPGARVLILTTDEMNQLQEMVGKYVATGKELLDIVSACLSYKLDKLTVKFEADLLSRAQDQAMFEGADLKTYMEAKLIEGFKVAVDGYL
jgi:hypothetical protein